ncbi:MAG: hypothetical protein GC154_20130 [bacterium]|nr:hypothetical protein [bacterium]
MRIHFNRQGFLVHPLGMEPRFRLFTSRIHKSKGESYMLKSLTKPLMALFILGVAISPAFSQVGIFDHAFDMPAIGNHADGSATLSGGVYTIKGNGNDIWGTADEFYYLYNTASGSHSLSAKIKWIDHGTNEWAKAGVMMREDPTDPSSRHYQGILKGLNDLIGPQWRPVQGGSSNSLTIQKDGANVVPGGDGYIWLRVTRWADMNTIGLEYSLDGSTWTFGDVRKLDFKDEIAYGLVVTNHEDDTNLATAEFSDVVYGAAAANVVAGVRTIAGDQEYFGSDKSYRDGDSFTVSLTLTNTYSSAQTVAISETVPSGWTVSEISDGGTEAAGVISWSVSAPSGEDSKTVSYKVTVPSSAGSTGSFSGSAQGLSISGDSNVSRIADPVGIFDAHMDIGAVGVAGSAELDQDEYYLTGSGADIWDTADQFHFLFKEVSGPFVFQANTLVVGSNDWTKGGIMVRDSLNANSKNYFNMVEDSNSLRWQQRTEDGAASTAAGSLIGTDQQMGDMRISRVGDTVTLEYLNITTNEWTNILTTNTSGLSDPVYVGLALTSHDNATVYEAYFANVELTEYDGWAERNLGSQVLPSGGGTITGNTLTVYTTPGKTLSDTLTENLPAGVTATNLQASDGTPTTSGNKISWTFSGFSGTATLTYDLNISASAANGYAPFSGDLGGLATSGDAAMFAVQFQVPKIDRSTTLDGVISAGEYDGAYTTTFDRADKVPPGVLSSPDGAELPRSESNATFYIFHNDQYINIAIDVLDKALTFNESTDHWRQDSVELYLDGNLSRSNPKENAAHGAQMTVLGDGSGASGNNAPTPAELPGGGYMGESPNYWNYGANVKASDGFIVEYQLDKSQMLAPVNRSLVGFDILMNSSEPGVADRTAKWGYWNTSPGAAETDAEYWDNETGWAVMELLGQPASSVGGWSLY